MPGGVVRPLEPRSETPTETFDFTAWLAALDAGLAADGPSSMADPCGARALDAYRSHCENLLALALAHLLKRRITWTITPPRTGAAAAYFNINLSVHGRARKPTNLPALCFVLRDDHLVDVAACERDFVFSAEPLDPQCRREVVRLHCVLRDFIVAVIRWNFARS